MTQTEKNGNNNTSEVVMNITRDDRSKFEGLRTIELPPELREIYGGDLDILPDPHDTPFTYLSFVMSREGIFGLKNAPGFMPISHGNKADSFMLTLLHAIPDAVMIGAGTLRAEPNVLWNTEFFCRKTPELCGPFRELRQSLGKEPYPPIFFVTNSGDINPDAAVFKDDRIKVYIATGERGARWAKERRTGAEILDFGNETLDQVALMKHLRQELDVEVLFHEGGKQVADAVVREGLAQQLFLTHMAATPSVEFMPEDAQYLLSEPNHQLPFDARVITERRDAKGDAALISVDIRDWGSL